MLASVGCMLLIWNDPDIPLSPVGIDIPFQYAKPFSSKQHITLSRMYNYFSSDFPLLCMSLRYTSVRVGISRSNPSLAY